MSDSKGSRVMLCYIPGKVSFGASTVPDIVDLTEAANFRGPFHLIQLLPYDQLSLEYLQALATVYNQFLSESLQFSQELLRPQNTAHQSASVSGITKLLSPR